MKPIIGITVDCAPDPQDPRSGGKLQLNWNYAQVIADAGGVPLLIPPQVEGDEILHLLDGLLIPGGNDIDACHWGEANHPSVEPIAPERFGLEKRLYNSLSEEMPVLGICYGCQFINVMRGGSLIQHLPDEDGSSVHTGGEHQTYQINPDSKLGHMVGEQMEGQSWHHQAIKQPGSGLKVIARSTDGTVEAVEAIDRPWMVGVQWHPERTFEDPATQKLFTEFIAAARKYHDQQHAVSTR
jgi:putative glutamine amidotransferase